MSTPGRKMSPVTAIAALAVIVATEPFYRETLFNASIPIIIDL
jgi:hypothetical protein